MKLFFKSKMLQAKQEAYLRQHPEEELADSFFRDLMDDQLSRGYLNDMPPAEDWAIEPAGLRGSYGWLRFNRLPIRPGKEEENTLLENWQSVLSACHTMKLRVAFVLLRRRGQTQIYLGACAPDGRTDRAAEQLRQCMAIHMPGAELQAPKFEGALEETLENYTRSGVVTGIPSLHNDRSGVTLQTLDKLARGIRIDGIEKTYAMVVLADPATDGEIVQLQQTFLELKSEIHQFVGYSTSEGFNQNTGRNSGGSVGIDLGFIMEALAGACFVTGNALGGVGFMGLSKISKSFYRGMRVTAPAAA